MNFTVEGTIGAGKSTLIRDLLNHYPTHMMVEEPVIGNPYLADYYKEPHRWSLALQTDFLSWRTSQYLNCVQNKFPVILDRSIYGDRAFSRAIYRTGYITEREHQTYLAFHRLMTEITQPTVDFVLYLKVDPKVAWERIYGRNREEEVRRAGGLTLEYLTIVGEEYDRVMGEIPVPVIEVNWNEFKPTESVLTQIEYAWDCILANERTSVQTLSQ